MSPMPEFPVENIDDDELDQSLIDPNAIDDDLINRKVSVCFPERCNLSIVDNNELKVASDMNGGDKQNALPRDASVDTLANSLLPLCSFEPSAWNAPLPLFTNGTLCLPYLSLPYMDLLSDPSVNGMKKRIFIEFCFSKVIFNNKFSSKVIWLEPQIFYFAKSVN